MLRQGQDGFTIDLERIEKKTDLSDDERLLLKLRGALETPSVEGDYELELTATESRRLAETVAQLEKIGDWASDVLRLSRDLRARLVANE